VVTEITLFEIPPSTCTATHPDLSKKYPLGAGFRRLSTSPQRQASAQPEPPGVVRRSAEKTTHLARRRGGGTTARAVMKPRHFRRVFYGWQWSINNADINPLKNLE